MLLIIRWLLEHMKTFDEKHRDHRVAHYPFMGSYLPLFVVLTCYYTFVKYWGPKLMEKRAPFDLKHTLLVYNALQVFLSMYIVVMSVYVLFDGMPYPNIACMIPLMDQSWTGHMETHLCYTYFIIKIVDFMDTVFFVLRKNYRQVTFLHVYHHIIMSICSYCLVRYYSGGHPASIGIINSGVHVVMYSYYFLSALSPDMKRSLWWKKYITKMQLIQFFILSLHFLLPLLNPDCQYPKAIAAFALLQNAVMAALFSDFYYKTYIAKSKTKGQSLMKIKRLKLNNV